MTVFDSKVVAYAWSCGNYLFIPMSDFFFFFFFVIVGGGGGGGGGSSSSSGGGWCQ